MCARVCGLFHLWYRRDELRAFLIDCRTMGLDVIPLVQTFGHMEVRTRVRYSVYMTRMNSVCIKTHVLCSLP
jgi:hypothetical protein